MSAQTVVVAVTDLAKLADLVSDRDDRRTAPTVENINACHNLIEKMLGDQSDQVYAPDDGSSVVTRSPIVTLDQLAWAVRSHNHYNSRTPHKNILHVLEIALKRLGFMNSVRVTVSEDIEIEVTLCKP